MASLSCLDLLLGFQVSCLKCCLFLPSAHFWSWYLLSLLLLLISGTPGRTVLLLRLVTLRTSGEARGPCHLLRASVFLGELRGPVLRGAAYAEAILDRHALPWWGVLLPGPSPSSAGEGSGPRGRGQTSTVCLPELG